MKHLRGACLREEESLNKVGYGIQTGSLLGAKENPDRAIRRGFRVSVNHTAARLSLKRSDRSIALMGCQRGPPDCRDYVAAPDARVPRN
jgi:hypothetical protein